MDHGDGSSGFSIFGNSQAMVYIYTHFFLNLFMYLFILLTFGNEFMFLFIFHKFICNFNIYIYIYTSLSHHSFILALENEFMSLFHRFIYTFLGVGILVCFGAFLGYMVSNYMSRTSLSCVSLMHLRTFVNSLSTWVIIKEKKYRDLLL